MQRMCARCAAVFRGRWALHVIWCKVDRFYVCRRCWEWECGEGHGKKFGAVGMPTWEAVLALLFFWCILGLPGVLAVAVGDPPVQALGIVANLPFASAAVWSLREGRRRSLLHREAIRGLHPVEIADEVQSRDESIRWRANSGWPFARRMIAAIVLAILAATFVGLVAWFIIPGAEPRELPVVGLTMGFILAFLGVAPPWAVLETGMIRPTALALTERGIHFWYPTPEERRLADGYVGWREVAFIGIRGSGKSRYRALERTNGVNDRPDFLTLENWTALVDEWKRRTAVPP